MAARRRSICSRHKHIHDITGMEKPMVKRNRERQKNVADFFSLFCCFCFTIKSCKSQNAKHQLYVDICANILLQTSPKTTMTTHSSVSTKTRAFFVMFSLLLRFFFLFSVSLCMYRVFFYFRCAICNVLSDKRLHKLYVDSKVSTANNTCFFCLSYMYVHVQRSQFTG